MPESHLPAMTLQRMCIEALLRDPAQQAIEFADEWVHWGQIRQMAERLHVLTKQSGLRDDAPIVFVSPNHPSSVAAFFAMLAQGRTVRMVYAFQSPAGLARDSDSLDAAIVVASVQDFSPELRKALHARGAAAIALSGMDAVLVPGLEHCRRDLLEDKTPIPEIQILTSGTTGPPKRLGLTHDMVARHIVGANKNYRLGDADAARQPPAYLSNPLI